MVTYSKVAITMCISMLFMVCNVQASEPMTPLSKGSLEQMFGKVGGALRDKLEGTEFNKAGDLSDIDAWCRDPQNIDIHAAYKTVKANIKDDSDPTEKAVKAQLRIDLRIMLEKKFKNGKNMLPQNYTKLIKEFFLEAFDKRNAWDTYNKSLEKMFANRNILDSTIFKKDGDLSDVEQWCRDSKNIDIEAAYKAVEATITAGSEPTEDAVMDERLRTDIKALLNTTFNGLTAGDTDLLIDDYFFDKANFDKTSLWKAHLKSLNPNPDPDPISEKPTLKKSKRKLLLICMAISASVLYLYNKLKTGGEKSNKNTPKV